MLVNGNLLFKTKRIRMLTVWTSQNNQINYIFPSKMQNIKFVKYQSSFKNDQV